MRAKQASLPMYDFPEIRWATDTWWAGIAGHLQREGIREVPASLLHDFPVHDLWGSEQLFFSQCSGFDLVYGYCNVLSALLTPDYEAPGCHNGHYCSLVVVHEDSAYRDIPSLLGLVAVINDLESHTGMNALLSLVNPYSEKRQFFQRILISGSHAASLQAVRERKADVAAIDAVTYTLLQRYRPAALEGIICIARTDSAPALPYVVPKAFSPKKQQSMQNALLNAFADPGLAEVREVLLLKGGLLKTPYVYQQIAENFYFDQHLLEVVI